MKKGLFSFLFVFAFAAYALYQYFGNSVPVAYTAPEPSATVSAPAGSSQQAASAPPPANPIAALFGEDDDSYSDDERGEGGRTPAAQTPAPAPAPTPAPVSAPAPAPSPAPATISQSETVAGKQNTGKYKDGTYTGSVADAYYGYVQVKATILGGKLTDVAFLQYPSDRSTSRYINSQAMPVLRQEAIAAQSAQVDGVSGATDTSAAFRESIAAALQKALNA